METKAVELFKNELRTGTFIISQGFKRDHHRILELIKKYESDFLDLETKNKGVLNGLIKRRVPIKKAGRPVDEILLNEQQFIFLGTLFRNTKVVVQFKKRLAREFVEQRTWILNAIQQKQNPGWQNVRRDGKLVYKRKTEVIKQFVEYATKQGSKSAHRYYTAFARMENSALFFFEQKYPNMREVLTIKQLMQIATADDVIEKAIEDGMEKEMFYKDIYPFVKKRVIAFVEIIGKTPVLALELKQTTD